MPPPQPSPASGGGGNHWFRICELADILPNTGVCALVGGRQIAVFRLAGEEQVHAIDNRDPHSGANVLSRGLIGDIKGELVVASPIYKQHYSLKTGRCLENPDHSINAYPTKVEDGAVWVDVQKTGDGRRETGDGETKRKFFPIPVLRPLSPTTKRRLVVIGNGMAGMRVVEELLELAPELYRITVFGEEPHGNYNRILLSPVLAGEKKPDEIMLNAPGWYAERGITLHAGDPVVAIDRKRRVVKSSKGVETSYDRLLLATGSRPVLIPVPGSDLPGVITFRDLRDVDVMLAAARSLRRAVVIGGGLLGLEAATGLQKRGMDVTVVHLMDRLMERQLDRPAAGLLQASLEKRGLRFRLQAQTEAILGSCKNAAPQDGAGGITGVRFKDGTEIPADLVVMAVGIRPNIGLAQNSGLRCERGVLVNDTLQTFDPRVYAVGECVQHRNTTYGLVAPLWDQARVCATHLAELGHFRYQGSRVSTKLKVTGIDVFSAGDFLGGEGTEDLVLCDPRRGIYKRLVIKNDRILGAVLFGDARDGNWYFDLMNEGTDIGGLRDKLLFGQAYAEKAA